LVVMLGVFGQKTSADRVWFDDALAVNASGEGK